MIIKLVCKEFYNVDVIIDNELITKFFYNSMISRKTGLFSLAGLFINLGYKVEIYYE